jgi:phosphate butyryltransferase
LVNNNFTRKALFHSLNFGEGIVEWKVKIIKNAVHLARLFGYGEIKVGVLSAFEFVNDDVPSSVDAKALSEMEWSKGVIVEGPFALDNALDEESARHKGIFKIAAGKADILLVPDFLAGNILYKSLHLLSNFPYAGTVCGTTLPAALPSRSDLSDTKYHSILVAMLQTL